MSHLTLTTLRTVFAEKFRGNVLTNDWNLRTFKALHCFQGLSRSWKNGQFFSRNFKALWPPCFYQCNRDQMRWPSEAADYNKNRFPATCKQTHHRRVKPSRYKNYRRVDTRYARGHFTHESSDAINCTGNDNQTWPKLEAKDVLTNINRTQAAERAEKRRFCPWWPWPSNSSEWGTKHVFRVNLAQIRSAVPNIFHTQKL